MFVERGCRGLLHSARFPSGANTLKAYPFTPLNPCKPPKTPSGTVTIRFEAPTEDNPSLTSASLLFLHPTILSLSLSFSLFLLVFFPFLFLFLLECESTVFAIKLGLFAGGWIKPFPPRTCITQFFYSPNQASRTIGSRCVYSILFSLPPSALFLSLSGLLFVSTVSFILRRSFLLKFQPS